MQMLLLGGVFWLARSPRRLELIGGTGGLVMIGIGASLALTGRRD